MIPAYILILALAAAVIYLHLRLKKTEHLKVIERQDGGYTVTYKNKQIYNAKPKSK